MLTSQTCLLIAVCTVLLLHSIPLWLPLLTRVMLDLIFGAAFLVVFHSHATTTARSAVSDMTMTKAQLPRIQKQIHDKATQTILPPTPASVPTPKKMLTKSAHVQTDTTTTRDISLQTDKETATELNSDMIKRLDDLLADTEHNNTSKSSVALKPVVPPPPPLPPVAPPLPPPIITTSLPLSSSSHHITPSKSPTRASQLKFKNCPLSPINCHPRSLFQELEPVSDSDWEAMVDVDAFTERFGLQSASGISSATVVEKRRDSGLGEDEDGMKPPSRLIGVLDDRRSYTIDLVLKQLRLSPEQIRQYVLEMNSDAISSNAARELLKLVPTDNELALFEPYLSTSSDDDKAPSQKIFRPPDYFMFIISQIPNYGTRVKALDFMHQYVDLHSDSMHCMSTLQTACRELLDHHHAFKVVLRYALSMGMYMNRGRAGWNKYASGITRGGFKVADLIKFMDVRANHHPGVGGNQQSIRERSRTMFPGSKRASHAFSPTPFQQARERSRSATAAGFAALANSVEQTREPSNLFEQLVMVLETRAPGSLDFYTHWNAIAGVTDLKDISCRSTIKILKEGISVLEILCAEPDYNSDLEHHLNRAKTCMLTLLQAVQESKKLFHQVLVMFNEIESDESKEDSDKAAMDLQGVTPEMFFGPLCKLVDMFRSVAPPSAVAPS